MVAVRARRSRFHQRSRAERSLARRVRTDCSFRCRGWSEVGGAAGRRMRRRAAVMSGTLHDPQADAAVFELLLADAVAALAGLQLHLLDGIRLQEPIQVLLITPPPLERVVPDRAGERVD